MISFCNRNQPVSGSRIFKTCSRINAETLKNNYVHPLDILNHKFGVVSRPVFPGEIPLKCFMSWVLRSISQVFPSRQPHYLLVKSSIFLSNIPSVTGCRSLGLHTHILSYYCIILYRIPVHIWNISYMYCCHIPTLCSCCINYIPKIPKTRFNTN